MFFTPSDLSNVLQTSPGTKKFAQECGHPSMYACFATFGYPHTSDKGHSCVYKIGALALKNEDIDIKGNFTHMPCLFTEDVLNKVLLVIFIWFSHLYLPIVPLHYTSFCGICLGNAIVFCNIWDSHLLVFLVFYFAEIFAWNWSLISKCCVSFLKMVRLSICSCAKD